ncbi:hypothetical protein [Kitasatospora sp. NPDC050543]|uniref:hypothetical protein n=1 Tax=Kitasatospora sp. NPDC050543 TaxID=3364054 RepID=UPI0037BA03A1
MNQRRSYPNSGEFNMDDLFRPEPGQPQGQQGQPQEQPQQYVGQPPVPGRPEYLGEGQGQGHAIPGQGGAWAAQQQTQAYIPAQTAPADPAPETQYLPPYPTADPSAGGYPGQQQAYQGAPQPGYGTAEPAYPGGDPAYAATGAMQVPGGLGHQHGGGNGRRPSGKLIIGGVVAGCTAAGILVGVLMSGDDKAPDTAKTTPPVASATGSAPATATAGATVSPEVKAQAQALSDLLGTANESRQAVIGAVSAVQRCDKLPESQQALTDAAGRRKELQTKLAALKTDKLTGGQQLVDQLNQAWQASATADEEYAAWAGDAQSGGCDPKKLDNPHYKTAVQASGSATTAKKQAAGLWNGIAGQTGLPTKTDGDL